MLLPAVLTLALLLRSRLRVKNGELAVKAMTVPSNVLAIGRVVFSVFA